MEKEGSKVRDLVEREEVQGGRTEGSEKGAKVERSWNSFIHSIKFY